MTLVLNLHSFKGGTGKSSLALNIAITMCKQGNKVALLDMDYAAPSIYTFFSSKVRPATSLNDVLLRKGEFSDALFDASSIIGAEEKSLYVALASSESDDTRAMARRGVKEASEDAQKLFGWIHTLRNDPFSRDIIVLDTTPGLNFLSVNSISASDISILLLRLVNSDLIGTQKMIEGLHARINSRILLLVNQLPEEIASEQTRGEIEQLIDEYIISKIGSTKPEYAGIITQDLDLIKMEAENMLGLLRNGREHRNIYALSYPEGKFSRSVEELTRKVLDGK